MTVHDSVIFSVDSPQFAQYGRIIQGFDASQAHTVAEKRLEIPAEGVVYQASLDFFEQLPSIARLGSLVFGGIDVQTGWCIGHNRKLNALEYHKSSEIIVALTPIALMLGVYNDIHDLKYPSEAIVVFTLPAGVAVELYPRTLHFAPLHLGDEGFAALIMLPRGTNAPLAENLASKKPGSQDQLEELDPEFPMLWMENKWMICHPDSIQAGRGAWQGITGENLELPAGLIAPVSR